LADPAGPALTLRFVTGPDVDALDVGRAEILAAVEGAVRAQGDGDVVLEPRVHLAPPNGGAGHFNVLRGHLGPEHVSGVKVVGDFVGNWRLGLPSELALVLLLDPDTGMPVGIVLAEHLGTPVRAVATPADGLRPPWGRSGSCAATSTRAAWAATTSTPSWARSWRQGARAPAAR
jgi:ornithine cyclodeaminase/alanine dehydrogenase-like protein (mu-crystallin family)